MSAEVAKAKVVQKQISKYSWEDGENKVKIRIDCAQFKGTITEAMIDVKYDEYLCDVCITDEEGV